jgi:hypothetical protein
LRSNQQRFIMKKEQTVSPDVSKTISELKRALVNDPESPLYRVSFKSYGRKFVITNRSHTIKDKLEKSFNHFMKALCITPGQKRIKGLCFLDRDTTAFKMAYMKEGEQVLHQVIRKKEK